jgi:hypothetical protein
VPPDSLGCPARIESDEAQRFEIVQQSGELPPSERLGSAVAPLEEQHAVAGLRVEPAVPHEMEDVKGCRQEGLAHLIQPAAIQEHDVDSLLLASPCRLEVGALPRQVEGGAVHRARRHCQDPQPARAGDRPPPLAMGLEGADDRSPPAQAEDVLRFRTAEQLPGQLLEIRRFRQPGIDVDIDPQALAAIAETAEAGMEQVRDLILE